MVNDYVKLSTGLIQVGMSFLGELTTEETWYALKLHAEYGTRSSLRSGALDSLVLSHVCSASGVKITGIRVWIGSINELAMVVTMVQA